MFKRILLEKNEDIILLKTSNSFLGKPFMWTLFMLIDNIFFDTGNIKSNRRKILAFIKELKHREYTIYNTHLHEDHCGNNKLLQDKLKLKIFAPRLITGYNEISWFFRLFWGKPDHFEFQELDHDEIITDTGRKIIPIPTPGHTPCHVAYFLKKENIIFTGDAIPLASNKKYSMLEEDYQNIIFSLKILLNIINDNTTVVDCHRGVVRAPKNYIQSRIINMEENVRRTKKLFYDEGLEINQIERIVFGRPARYIRFTTPRFNLRNTITSIINKNKEK